MDEHDSGLRTFIDEDDPFLVYAQGWVEWMEAEHTTPDADWFPTAFLQVNPIRMQQLAAADPKMALLVGQDRPPEMGDRALVHLPLPGDPADSQIALALQTLLRKVEATRVILVLTVYLSRDEESRQKYGTVEKDPTAIEAILLLDVTKDDLGIWIAPIVRSDLPPMLAPWKQEKEGAETSLTDYLKEGLV